ncbi:MAG: glycosyltransferase family 2 protein [Bacteroidota bacterium]|nr:glycosyltransferase family 2 protein [Bacteroidota bacterium]MDP4273327.1 glycosyltransferase family 2 protein [Bacteroidota bacterium]
MVKLSVVIITLNEEENIERCLLSVREIADEIVVVDSYSFDKTREICEAFPVRFIQHKFQGYVEQKRWATEQSVFPYVLSIDADEAISEQLKQSILYIKNNWKSDGYYFSRFTKYCGRWLNYGSFNPDFKLRLFDKRKGQWAGLNPHDRFELQHGASKIKLKGKLLHYSFDKISEHVEQINSFSTIQANSYYAIGRKASIFTIIFHSSWRFFQDYILRLGFLDGFQGLTICINCACCTFLKYVKLRQIIRRGKVNSNYWA